MRRFRLYLYGTITLFVLGVIVAGLVSLFFDLNSLKPTLVEAAFEATGRELAIDGNIEFSLFPRPRATASRIRLSNTGGGSEPDAITIEIASAQVAWLPLLTGTVDVRQIQVSGVRVLVEEGADKKGSLAFTAPKGPSEEDDGPLPNLISFTDLSVVLRDGATDHEVHVSQFVLRPRGNGGQTDVVVALDRNGTGVVARGTVGDLGSIAGPDPFPVALAIEAAGSTLRIDGTLSDVDGNLTMDFLLSAKGTSLMALSPIVGARLPLDKKFDFSARLQGSVKMLSVREVVLSIGLAQVTGAATLDLSSARPRLTAHLRPSNFDLSQFSEGPSSARGDRAESGGPILTGAPLPLWFTRCFDADLTVDVEAAELLGLSLRNIALAIKSQDGLATIETLAADRENHSFVNPLLLLVPVIEGVTAEKTPCLTALEQAELGEAKPTGAIRGVGRSLGKDRE